MRSQMTLDTVHAEELARRDNYYTKLKNDNYFWYVQYTYKRHALKAFDSTVHTMLFTMYMFYC